MIGLTNPIQAPKSGNVELAAEGTLVSFKQAQRARYQQWNNLEENIQIKKSLMCFYTAETDCNHPCQSFKLAQEFRKPVQQ